MNLGQTILEKKRSLSRQISKNKAQGAPFWCWPLALFNRICGRITGQRLLISQGHAYWLQDERRSCTLEVLQFEAASGFYDPPLELRPGDTVIDLGAHVGGFVIPLAKKNPRVLFISYEPDPINFNNLVYNLLRYEINNVAARNAGLASDSCNLKMNHDASNTGASFSEASQDIGVPGYPLSRLVGARNVCRLLKIDVEGAEHEAITKDSNLACVESLIAEVHADVQRGWNPTPTIKIIQTVPVHRISVEPGPHRVIRSD